MVHTFILMDDPFDPREFGWTECSESGFSNDLFADEVESKLQTSDEEELPFARHGPVLEANLEELSNQRDFWISHTIGFILDYHRFSVSHLQHIISIAWRIQGAVHVARRESSFYLIHFESMDDLNHVCEEGLWSVDGALFILEKWRLNLVISKFQVNFISV